MWGRGNLAPKSGTNSMKTITKIKNFVKKRKLLIFGFIVLVLIILLILPAGELFNFSTGSLEILPEPDLTGIEIQVVEKLRTLRKEVVKNPDSPDAWGKYAMNLDIHDFKQEALICYKQASELSGSEFRWPYFTAIIYTEMGSTEAFNWFERSSKIKPDYAPLYVLYGRALYDAGLQEPAMKEFIHAIEIDSTYSHAYLGIAKILFYQMEIERSRDQLEKALKFNPLNGEAYALLAQVYRRLGEQDKADKALKMKETLPKVTSIPDSVYGDLIVEGVSAAWYQERGKSYMKKGLYERAIHEFQSVLKLRPDAEDHNNLGLSFQKIGKYDQAILHFRQSVALNPQKIEANVNLATALFEAGYIDEAVAFMKKAQRMDPDFPNISLMLGTIYMQSGQTKSAVTEYQTGLSKDPEDIHLAVQLAWILATSSKKSHRDGDKAIRLAKKVCEKTNYLIPEMLDVLAAAYAESGQFDQALKTAQRAYQLAKSNNKKHLMEQIRLRIDLYRLKQPYRSRDF
jgi:tetratricopeptide (TPR) repeat protein